MAEKVKNLIVGCGFSGVTMANKLATELKEEVLIIDAKDHIGGNSYDYYNQNGICIHKYGAHIFHTNIKEVWDYLSQYTKWHPYMHEVKGLIDGQKVPIPFNLNSIEKLFPPSMAEKLEKKLVENFGFNKRIPILQLRETNDKDLEFLANYIYEKVFLGYTLKQWGVKPENLDTAVTGRVPVYISKDDRYFFQDKYQGIPKAGYTALVNAMLNNPLIKVHLGTSFESIKKAVEYDRLFYTGPIDEYFGYAFDELPYRSLKFDFVDYNQEYLQESAVVNYPCNYNFTRIVEYKYFLNDKSNKTIVSFEYPEAFKRGKNERYYPIANEANQELYNKYLAEAAKLKNVYFLGRLGDYKYYDMDQAVNRSLELFKEIKEEAKGNVLEFKGLKKDGKAA